MIKKEYLLKEQLEISKNLLKWLGFVLPVAIITGLFVALFLWLLEVVTELRWSNSWLIYLMPLAGVFIALLYKYLGNGAEAGNNLILEVVDEGLDNKANKRIPLRMAPLILITTVITHLFGGSAGREGTAVQIGGSIAAYLSKILGFAINQHRIIIMCGIAAGFGAVFGTPIAGTIFALEVLAIGRIRYDALLPCLMASIIADVTCSLCGIHHTHYQIDYSGMNETYLKNLRFDIFLLLKTVFAGIIFGLAALLFSKLSETIKLKSKQYIHQPLFIPVIGALLVIVISYLLGTFDYLGLGVTSKSNDGISIIAAFSSGGVKTFSWFWKLLLTTITLSMGFKGGEVTPLFFIGACLGNSLAIYTGSPVDLFAGIGFVAVFAAATHTPLACTIMGLELFGTENIIYIAVACFVAYYFSGHKGIYHSQKIAVSKLSKHNDL